MILGEFTQDTLRELKVDSQNRVFKINQFLNRAVRPTWPTRRSRSSATTRWTCSGERTASFYLLTYGDGFFNINADAGMYKWQYVKGTRAPTAVLTHGQDRRAAAADGQVLERRLERRRSW